MSCTIYTRQLLEHYLQICRSCDLLQDQEKVKNVIHKILVDFEFNIMEMDKEIVFKRIIQELSIPEMKAQSMRIKNISNEPTEIKNIL